MPGKKSADWKELRQLGVLTTVPIILLIGPVVGFFLGGWIDRKSHIYPWFTIIFITLGFIASGREVIRLVKEASQNGDEPKQNGP